jgi:tetratricopeptide (TPR) repeat protein
LRGIILKRHSQYKKAIQCLLQVAKAEVNEPPESEKARRRSSSFVNLGLCYQAINDMDTAIGCYLKAIDLSSDFSIEDLNAYYDNIRSLSKDRHLFNDAINWYQDIRLLRAHFPRAGLGEFKNIFYKYQKIKKSVLAHIQKAQAYFKVKQHKKAIKELKEAIKLDYTASRIHNVHLFLGFCYERIKQYKKAISELKKAKKISPKEPQVNLLLYKCYRNIGPIEQSNKELYRGEFLNSKEFKKQQL